ncbi:MAG: ABC transporter permease [Planctomycetota bacterium]
MGLPLRYNYRNLLRRKLRTGLTVLGIALVITTAVIMLAYGRGLLHSLRNNGDPTNAVILARRATDCTASSLKKGEFEILSGLVAYQVAYHFERTPEDEAAGRRGKPIDLLAPYVHHSALVNIEGAGAGRYGDRKQGLIQGVDPQRAFHVHEGMRLRAGRQLQPSDERVAMVGALAHARLGVRPEDVAVGKVLEFHGVSWPIVGVFEAAGMNADGEIWVPIDALLTVLNRTDYSHAVIKAKSPQDLDRILQLVNRSDQTELRAVTETEFYTGYAETFRTFALLAGVMAMVITIGGITVGMNTMYTAVMGRLREIAMLQVLGFSRRAIVLSFVLESLFMALAGGLLGCGLGQLVNGWPMTITMGVFLFRVDLPVVALALGLAVVVGTIGAYVPVRRAVRVRVVDAMRAM